MKAFRQALPGPVLAGLCALVLVGSYSLQQALSWYQTVQSVAEVQAAAEELVASASQEQRQTLVMDYDQPARVQWHFIPKDTRKGWKMGEMSEEQRQVTHRLLRGLLSQMGYNKSTHIMNLERLLAEVEKGSGPIRDPLRYYITFFNAPSDGGRWGVSVEGHHLSLNFVLEGGRVVSSSPQMFGSNPALVKQETESGIPVGTRVLDKEETVAFELARSLSDEQMQSARIADQAPREIRAAGEAQPPTDPAVGIAYGELNPSQRELLLTIVEEYVNAMPEEVAGQRREAVRAEGLEDIHFAWAGATAPGIGHYYRIQGARFLIEFVNTQPDAMGNPANHIHCVWRDLQGDFALAIQ